MEGGGAFLGNIVYKDEKGNVTKVIQEQVITSSFLGALDKAHGVPGKSMMHEVSEAYEGAANSLSSGLSAPRATQADKKDPQSAYIRAHNAATPHPYITEDSQNGDMYTKYRIKGVSVQGRYYNSDGSIYIKFYNRKNGPIKH